MINNNQTQMNSLSPKRSLLMLLMTVVLMFAGLTTSASGHSYMTSPPADWNPRVKAWCRLGGPRGSTDNCPGPCIAESSSQFLKNARTTTWRRGQTQTVAWNRNTHDFGFVRMTLVPKKDRMNKKVHDANVFRYACYDSNIRNCRNRAKCGTGKTEGTTTFTVPPVPDGEYVLGWSWYGSDGDQRRNKPRFHFGDYWSCSNIRVSGGIAPVRGRAAFKPQLVTGMKTGTCRSLGNRLGVCAREPCRGAYGNRYPSPMCPAGFKLSDGKCFPPFDNKKSSPITVSKPRKVTVKKGTCCDRRSRARPHLGGIYLRGLSSRGNPTTRRCLCRHNVISRSRYPHGVAFEVIPAGQKTYQLVRFKINGETRDKQRVRPYILTPFKPAKSSRPVKIEAYLLMNNGANGDYNIASITFQ